MPFVADPKTVEIDTRKAYTLVAVLNDALIWHQDLEGKPIPDGYVAMLHLWGKPGDVVAVSVEAHITGEYEFAGPHGSGRLDVTASLQEAPVADINGRPMDWTARQDAIAWEYLHELMIEADAEQVARKEVMA